MAAGDLRCFKPDYGKWPLLVTAASATVRLGKPSAKKDRPVSCPRGSCCVLHSEHESRRGDTGGVAVPRKKEKEAAAEEARVRALGFKLWSMVRKLEHSWTSDPPYAKWALSLALWDTCIGSSSSTQLETKDSICVGVQACFRSSRSVVSSLLELPLPLPLPLLPRPTSRASAFRANETSRQRSLE